MKEFRKNSEGHFVCEECGKTYKCLKGLSKHINLSHYRIKKYYDKWVKEDNEGKCKKCGKNTSFIGRLNSGYKDYCSIKCKNENWYKEYSKTCKELYDSENYFSSDDGKRKIQETVRSKYGVDYITQSEVQKRKSKFTKRSKYGNENFNNRKKFKETSNNRYGCNHPIQHPEFYKKLLRRSFAINLYKDTNLTYQGSYELDFLENFHDKIYIENGPSVPYLFEGKNKVYHSDFFIPSRNMVIEIKNSYLLNKDKNVIKAKEEATISNGFGYLLIIDRNYTEFKKLIFRS